MIEMAEAEYMLRGTGYVSALEDLRHIAARRERTAARRSCSRTSPRSASAREMRRGIAELDGEGEVVGGIVVMRYGRKCAARPSSASRQKLAELARACPRASRSSRPTTARR